MFRFSQGFVPHIISTASEWTMCVSELVFFLTYANEFQKMSMTRPEVTIVADIAWYADDALLSGSDEVVA